MVTVAPDGEMVVATPERVAFNYAVAGLGSRFVAQLIDVMVILLLLAVLSFGVFGLAGVTSGGSLAGLVFVILVNLLIFGYFLICEGAFSGLTPGKRVMRLRVVGDGGQPVSFSQAAVRNLVRLADFLPALYAVGIVTLFANGRGKRLGDLAAGTVVVRERASITLPQLVWLSRYALARGAQAASRSPAAPALPVRLDPQLREFVTAYASRRHLLHPYHRAQLAERARAGLAQVLPDVVAREGALAALDRLVDRL